MLFAMAAASVLFSLIYFHHKNSIIPYPLCKDILNFVIMKINVLIVSKVQSMFC